MSAQQLAQALRRLIAELPVRVTNYQQFIHLSAAHIEGIGQACVKVLQAIEAAPQQESVAWIDERVIEWLKGRGKTASITTTLQAHKSTERPMPLYAAPQHAGRADVQPVDTQAALDVLAERRRQVSAEGWTPEHDDEHHQGSLSHAAAMYAVYGNVSYYGPGNPPSDWPWHADWWKPAASHRRNLVKAGALILAEIERLDRAARAEKGGA